MPSTSCQARSLVLVMVLATPGPAAFAQDRTAPPADTTGPAASQSGLLSEPSFMTKAIDRADNELNQGGEPKDGFYPELGNMITGSGWISAGPGYRHHLFNDQAVINVSRPSSWNLYKMAQGRFELPHLANDHLSLGLAGDLPGFAPGELLRAGQRLRSNPIGVGIDWTRPMSSATATVRTTPWLSVSGRFGWIHQAELSTMTGWSVTYPNTLDVFSDATAPGLSQQPAFLHGDVSVAADTRNHPGHPTRGGLYRVTAASYSDRDYGMYSFRRYEAEAAQFVPLVGRQRGCSRSMRGRCSPTRRAGTRSPSTSCRAWVGRTRCAGTTTSGSTTATCRCSTPSPAGDSSRTSISRCSPTRAKSRPWRAISTSTI